MEIIYLLFSLLLAWLMLELEEVFPRPLNKVCRLLFFVFFTLSVAIFTKMLL